jgi:F0F1-type ATP synthase membrane subunit b/b'
MPQLDIMTFFSQFFWFSFGFFIFYTLILHYILPLIFVSLNFRKKKLENLSKLVENKSHVFINFKNYKNNELNNRSNQCSNFINSLNIYVIKKFFEIEIFVFDFLLFF